MSRVRSGVTECDDESSVHLNDMIPYFGFFVDGEIAFHLACHGTCTHHVCGARPGSMYLR